MIKVSRVEFLKTLEMLSPGVSSRGIIDQSNCYVFRAGAVHTFNGEVSCYSDRGLNGIDAAVAAGPMLAQLQKWVEDELEIDLVDGVLWVYGVRKKASFNAEVEVHLPVDSIERPTDWSELPPKFAEALSLVGASAGRDAGKFQTTCVHLHPHHLEATDDVQVSRYSLETLGMEDTLVRATAVRAVAGLGMTHFGLTKAWVHFKNGHGLVYSCLRYDEPFPDVTDALRVEGSKTQFPKSLQEAVDKAEVFSRERGDDNQVTVSLVPGKVRVKGVGSSGSYQEVKESTYDGQPMSFLIHPKTLAEVVKDHNEVYVSEDKLVVDGGAWVWRTCTGRAEE